MTFSSWNRQPAAVVCRPGVMVMLVLAGSLAAQSAGAEVAVGLIVDASAPAPTSMVLTATTASDDTIIAYDWGRLETPTRCRQQSCVVDVPITSCRRVDVEVTTLLGETAETFTQACVRDELGDAPQVEVAIRNGGARFEVSATAFSSRGGTLVFLWVDDRGPVGANEVIAFDDDDSCHVVDAVAVDERGHLGFDRRSICGSEDAPRAWIGLDAVCPPTGSTQTVCVEVEHPLGRAVTTSTASAFDVNACATRTAPSTLTREVFVGSDDRDLRVFASTFLCGSPTNQVPRLFFARLPEGIVGESGTALELMPTLYGGTPPFSISAAMAGAGAIAIKSENTSNPKIEVSRLPFVALDDEAEAILTVTMTDAGGLTATDEVVIRVSGKPVVTNPKPSGGLSSGCSTTPVVLSPWLCLMALGVFHRRRR